MASRTRSPLVPQDQQMLIGLSPPPPPPPPPPPSPTRYRRANRPAIDPDDVLTRLGSDGDHSAAAAGQTMSGAEVKQKLAEYLEKRPSKHDLIEHNIIKSINTDPKLQQAMLALMRTQRESCLTNFLRKRRSLQQSIDHDLFFTGHDSSGTDIEARRRILIQLRESQINTLLEESNSYLQKDGLRDTMTWTRILHTGIVPSPRNCHSLCAIGEKLYLLGGFAAQQHPRHPSSRMMSSKHAELLVLDVATKQWKRPVTAGMLPQDRYSHASAVIGSRMYVFGGFCASLEGGGGYLNDVHVLDTESKQTFCPVLSRKSNRTSSATEEPVLLWYETDVIGDPPCPRAAHSSAVWDNKIIYFGGNSGSMLFNDIIVLDTESLEWNWPKVSGDIPSPRASHSATIFSSKSGSVMFIFGGATAEGPCNDLFALDLQTWTWSRPQMYGTPPRPRVGHIAVAVHGAGLLIFGGGTVDKVFDDLHVFDIGQSSWIRPGDSGTVPIPRAGHAAAIVGSRLHVFGGANADNQVFNDLHVLDTAFLSLSSGFRAGSPQSVTGSFHRRHSKDISGEIHSVQDREAQMLTGRLDSCITRFRSMVQDVRHNIALKYTAQHAQTRDLKELLYALLGNYELEYQELKEQVEELETFVLDELEDIRGALTSLIDMKSSQQRTNSGPVL